MEDTSPSNQTPHPETLHNASAETSLTNHQPPTDSNQPTTSPTDTKTNVSSPPNETTTEEPKVDCRNITKKTSRTDTKSKARKASKVDKTHAFIVSEQNVSRKGSKTKSPTTCSREPVTITDFPCSADTSSNIKMSNMPHDLPILTSTVASLSKTITTVSSSLTCMSNQASKLETVTSVLSNLPNISQDHSPVSITCRITQTPPTMRPISPNMRSPSNLQTSSNKPSDQVCTVPFPSIGRPSLLPTSPHTVKGSRAETVTSRPATIPTVSGGAVPEPTHAALHMAEDPTQRKPRRRGRRPSPPARR